MPGNGRFSGGPPIGIEPMTYALREACSPASIARPAPMTRRIAPVALIALEFRGLLFHDPFHGQAVDRRWPQQDQGPDRLAA